MLARCDPGRRPIRNLILVIEDEPGIVDFLEHGLHAQGFDVISATDGIIGGEKALRENIDLVVLDMMLPKRGGGELLDDLHRLRPALPVIVLTALDDVDQRVTSLDAGAVDYLTKPFSLSELAARIRAQLRVASNAPATTIRAGNIEANLLTRELRRDDQVIRLSSTEFELLVYLMRQRGRVISREQILRAVWGYDHDPGTNVVDVYVGYLRRKLRHGDRRAPIVTIRAVGYRFDASD